MKNTIKNLAIIYFILISSVTGYSQKISLNNTKIDGYKGVWFTLGQYSEYGDKYSGGLGTYTAKHIPMAIYAPKVQKTFFVYGGMTEARKSDAELPNRTQKDYGNYLLCMVGCFDHKTNTLTKPTVVCDKNGVYDPHDNPSIAMDSDGYLWIFVSGRNTTRLGGIYKSRTPYNVDYFDLIKEVEITYPQPKYLPGQGFLNLFTKYTGVRQLYFNTSENGIDWTPDKLLAAIKRDGDQNAGHYQISGQYGNKIVFFFNWHPNGNVDQRTNIYYLQTVDFGKNWTLVDGTPVQISVTESNTPTLIREFFSKQQNVYIKDVAFDENGNPVALYLSGKGHQPGPKNGLKEWAVIYWNGKDWENHTITTSDHNYDTGSLWVTKDKWTVVAPTENSPQAWGAGGELVIWESTDKGKTWKSVKQITKNSPVNHNYVRKVVNGIDPFQYFWADGNPDKLSQSNLYFGDSQGNVWKMPYEMKNETQTPEQIGLSQHPRIYISGKQKNEFATKIQTIDWAKQSYQNLKNRVEPYVDRHQTDPEWIISRMQMYWDTHYERVYVKGSFYSHGTGKAPVPTVKFQGARDWETDYAMPSLEETQPYMDEKGMYLQNLKKERKPWEWVHPSKTGRMIGPMNDRILSMASDAAFLYWLTGEKKYAVFAKDIFMTYVQGIHYRREPFALENYTNSHLMGLATFEVILDHVIPHMAVCYDFLYDYLVKEKADINMVQTVLKRFADQQIMYGVPDNNWNIFQAQHVAYLALALEDNADYADKKGRQYYLNEIFNNTTIRQFALKETMELFDPENGMWPESATYSMSVCNDMLDILCLVDNAENNHILDTFPIMRKAVPSTVEYVFPNGRITAFGDAKYVPVYSEPLEKMISLYRKYGEKAQEKELTEVLQQMMKDGYYKRDENKSIFSLFFYVDRLMDTGRKNTGYQDFVSNTFYIPGVSLLMQRNGMDKQNGLAVSLVGANGNHAHANGISMEMYGKAWILAPESSYGVSYGSKDNQEYYARFPAHNTVIVDGISDYGMMRSNYPFELLSCYPASQDRRALSGNITFARVSLTEPKTDALQERLTSIVRINSTAGYVVDIFRSKRKNGKDLKHEYLYHSIGQNIDFFDTSGSPLKFSKTEDLSSSKGDMNGYDYFKEKTALKFDNHFKAKFNINLQNDSNIYVNLWMKGSPGRILYSVMSPTSNALVKGSVSDDLLNKPLPTLIVKQEGEAWKRPFIAVYEPYTGLEQPSVKSVEYFGNADEFTGITVFSKQGRIDHIFNASGEQKISHLDMEFQGNYGVVSVNGNELQALFLGEGSLIAAKGWQLQSVNPKTQANLVKNGKKYILDCTGEVSLKTPSGKIKNYGSGRYEIEK